jgi:HD-like signal output (HDOD) protein
MSSTATASIGWPEELSASDKTSLSTPEDRAAALLFLRNLAAELSTATVNAPGFPDVVARIRKALADRASGSTETLRIVGAEPRLAARLLQAANAVSLSYSGNSFTDLRAAIARLGPRAVQSSAMAFAVQQLRLAPALRSISGPVSLLWKNSIAVACISQILARRTRINPDEAFLTGLLHDVGRLYIMIRAVDSSTTWCGEPPFMDMIDDWHPVIGKSMLQQWGFADALCEAVGLQGDYQRGAESEPELTDVLIAGAALARSLREPEPRSLDMIGIPAFHRLHLTAEDCAAILKHAEYQFGSLHDVLGC